MPKFICNGFNDGNKQCYHYGPADDYCWIYHVNGPQIYLNNKKGNCNECSNYKAYFVGIKYTECNHQRARDFIFDLYFGYLACNNIESVSTNGCIRDYAHCNRCLDHKCKLTFLIEENVIDLIKKHRKKSINDIPKSEICIKCKKEKEYSEFHYMFDSKYTVEFLCRDCYDEALLNCNPWIIEDIDKYIYEKLDLKYVK